VGYSRPENSWAREPWEPPWCTAPAVFPVFLLGLDPPRSRFPRFPLKTPHLPPQGSGTPPRHGVLGRRWAAQYPARELGTGHQIRLELLFRQGLAWFPPGGNRWARALGLDGQSGRESSRAWLASRGWKTTAKQRCVT